MMRELLRSRLLRSVVFSVCSICLSCRVFLQLICSLDKHANSPSLVHHVACYNMPYIRNRRPDYIYFAMGGVEKRVICDIFDCHRKLCPFQQKRVVHVQGSSQVRSSETWFGTRLTLVQLQFLIHYTNIFRVRLTFLDICLV